MTNEEKARLAALAQQAGACIAQLDGSVRGLLAELPMGIHVLQLIEDRLVGIRHLIDEARWEFGRDDWLAILGEPKKPVTEEELRAWEESADQFCEREMHPQSVFIMTGESESIMKTGGET